MPLMFEDTKLIIETNKCVKKVTLVKGNSKKFLNNQSTPKTTCITIKHQDADQMLVVSSICMIHGRGYETAGLGKG